MVRQMIEFESETQFCALIVASGKLTVWDGGVSGENG